MSDLPESPKRDAKPSVLNLRITAQLAEGIAKRAGILKCSKSEWARQVLERALSEAGVE